MIPVPIQLRAFLCQAYGIEPHSIAYFNEQEPNIIYVVVHGKLNYIDLSDINLSASRIAEKGGFDLSGNSTTSIRSVKSIWRTLTDVEREQLEKERRKRKSYKTSLCRAFRETNKCEYGEACIFAHGEKELRLPPKAHPKYKTQLCNKFSMWNYCPYGSHCQFIHQRLDKSMESTSMMRTGNSGNIENNSLHMDSFSMEQMNSNIRYMSSPLTLEKQLLFAEQSVNNQSIGNAAYGDQSLGGVNSVAGNTNLDQRILVDNSNIIKRLSEGFMNMSIQEFYAESHLKHNTT
uniref:C3H1-type domain-containing protein n=1 Tax=Onchocerca volvulus TaxID=6282 RepID=A0A8R1TLZ3_ONCVO